MSSALEFPLPDAQRRKLRSARRIEIGSIVYLVSVAVVMGLAAGSSQAMQTAWVEDMLGLVPPIAFLVGATLAKRPASRKYPFGYHRATSIAFLVAAVAQSATGLFLLVDGTIQLVKREHPVIGHVSIFGHSLWLGWFMLAALTYSVVPMMVLGRRKLPLARALHDKALATDADLNKDDWLTGIMGALGVIGIGIGWWWADATTALVISLLVCRDGFRNLAASISDLMDSAPTTVDHQPMDRIIRQVQDKIERLPWVAEASVRLREHGNFLIGDVIVVPRSHEVRLADLERARRRAEQVDWRVSAINIVPRASTRGCP